MKTLSKLTMMMAAMIIVALITSCGKEGGSTGGDAYIPDIGQQWQKLNTPSETYYFNYIGTANAASGTFKNGFKNAGNGGTIKGNFNHSQINFTLTLNTDSTVYSGTISGSPSNTMVLTGKTVKAGTSTSTNLTLTKQ